MYLYTTSDIRTGIRASNNIVAGNWKPNATCF